MIDRAEFPVQRNKTFSTLLIIVWRRFDESVAQSDDRLDLIGGGAKLRPQASHVHIHRACLDSAVNRRDVT